MQSSELKNSIISRIKQIDDVAFLEALYVLMEDKINSDKYRLSSFENLKLDQARMENNYIDHKAAMEELEQWLKE
jgi:hypothetical protein